MGKSRPFSVYLLKSGFNASNAMEENSGLVEVSIATQLPTNSSLFISDNVNGQPWWKSYFGVPTGERELPLTSKGGLLFVKHAERCFAMTFGHAHHKINDEAIEYDFGLRVTLNCVDPEKLNSTDTHDPETARRQRTQIPIDADLTFFDFDYDSNVLKSLTGKVKSDYDHLFKNATGSHSFKFSTRKTANELNEIFSTLWKLYESENYLQTFPNIRNVSPVSDPQIVQDLNCQLMDAFNEKEENLYLTIPELIDYKENLKIKFTGFYGKTTYDEVQLQNYYSYLSECGQKLSSLTIEDLKSNRMLLMDDNNQNKKSYTIFKCLVYDTKLTQNTEQTYHLSEGYWYKVENSYVEQMRQYLDKFWKATKLPDFFHADEGEYNKSVAQQQSSNVICLDTENISPNGETQMEPCDLYSSANQQASFIHVKRSTFSQRLSHLFYQGINSAEAIRMMPESLEKLKELVSEANVTAGTSFEVPSSDSRFDVRYAIITHKDPLKKSDNIPFFSRISLMKTLKQLQLMGLDCGYEFIPDKKK